MYIERNCKYFHGYLQYLIDVLHLISFSSTERSFYVDSDSEIYFVNQTIV